MLDLGFVSAILSEKSFEEVIQFAAKEQFKCVEVMCWPTNNADARRYAGVAHIDVDNFDSQVINQILLENKISISGLGYYPNPLEPNPALAEMYVEHIKKIIKTAAKLNIPVVNTFIGRNPSLNVSENLKLFAKTWPAIIKVAEEYNVKIGIENCPMFFTDDEWPGGKNLATSPVIWDKLFEIIPSPIFGLNYDPSHFVWQMMDYVSPLIEYKDRLHHIHLKDVKINYERLNRVGILANPLQYHTPKLPGFGDINWGKFFSALHDARYRGPVAIEVEDKAFEGSEADAEKALRVARNYLKQYLD